jgi:hypothetical protein
MARSFLFAAGPWVVTAEQPLLGASALPLP